MNEIQNGKGTTMKSFSSDLRWDDLRNRAIQILNTNPPNGNSMTEETVRLMHELDVYRIELELENRKLILAKEQAEKGKNEYLELFNLCPTGLIELTPEGVITRINISGADMLGLDPAASLIDLPLDILLSKESQVNFDEYLKSLQENEGIKITEVSILINHRKLKELEISGIYNENTNSFFISVNDVTKNKKTEEHLVRSKEKAETADRHKSSFLSTMSHEIRAPLNSIIGFSGILLQEIPGNLNEEQKKQVGMIQSSGRHLLTMINDLLDLSKIEAGQLKINMEYFNLNEVLEDVVQLEWPLANEKKIKLDLKISPEIGVIKSDKQRIHQILLNILNNAIKFTEKGSVTINCFKDLDRIKIEIKDTGIGIKEENLGKIFDPFIQIENDLTKTQGGSGLGLPVTKKFLELLQGTLSVNSVFGEGTTFSVSLPLE